MHVAVGLRLLEDALLPFGKRRLGVQGVANQTQFEMKSYRTSFTVVYRLNRDLFSAHTRVAMEVPWRYTSVYSAVRQIFTEISGSDEAWCSDR